MGVHTGGSGYGGGSGGGGKPLTPEDIQAINYYTGEEGYQLMNMRARGEMPSLEMSFVLGLSEEAFENVDRNIASLDKALDKLPGYTGTVYRGMHLPNSDLKKMVKTNLTGSMLDFPAFTSTTRIKEKIFAGNVKFVIRAKGKNGKAIEQYSKEKGEQEVLFSRNSKFRVKNVIPGFETMGGKQALISVKYELEEI